MLRDQGTVAIIFIFFFFLFLLLRSLPEFPSKRRKRAFSNVIRYSFDLSHRTSIEQT